MDSNGIIYIVYKQAGPGGTDHIYLSRYNGIDVRIWDNGTSDWTNAFANGDPIDTGTTNDASCPMLVTDTNQKVYITYKQILSGKSRIYLSRYVVSVAVVTPSPSSSGGGGGGCFIDSLVDTVSEVWVRLAHNPF